LKKLKMQFSLGQVLRKRVLAE